MSTKLSENGLIPAEDLYYLLAGPEKIKLLDATYSMPDGQSSPFQGFLTRHIEGAQFFDIDAVADQDAPLSHTIPSPEYFADCVESLGISNSDHVVIYDQSGSYMASPRAWWMFRLFGHENVYVLEGGIQSWISAGFKTESGPAESPPPGHFKPVFRQNLIVSREDVLKNINEKTFTVVDARSAARFNGTAPEPRAGMRTGHIPESKNIPFTEALNHGTRLFKPDAELEQLFVAHNIAQTEKIAVSCGSGVTACTLALALFKTRGQNAAIYDGSWSEWGDKDSGMPIEVSA